MTQKLSKWVCKEKDKDKESEFDQCMPFGACSFEAFLFVSLHPKFEWITILIWYILL